MGRKILFAAALSLLTVQCLRGTTPDTTKSVGVAAFDTLLCTLDLNAQTQAGFAITETEYQELVDAWQALTEPEKNGLLNGSAADRWKDTCAMVLLYGLRSGENWEMQFHRLCDLRRQGLSLTLSLSNNPVPLAAARRQLVDLLVREPTLVSGGRLSLSEEIKSQAAARVGYLARGRLERWERLINGLQTHPAADKIKVVNDFFNQEIQRQNDQGAIRTYDYWQSPIETLVRGVGDCDDFAMAKYVSLRLLGIPTGRLHLAAFQGSRGGHIVLIYDSTHSTDRLVLDCLPFLHLGQKRQNILPLSLWIRKHEVRPLYEVNEKELILFDEAGQTVTLGDPRGHLPKLASALRNSQNLLTQPRRCENAETRRGGEVYCLWSQFNSCL
ncbi:MAG: hypothetical protein D6743_16585 [Calditrichaeota bacterium]|nr:MAG: hypothetical protein D6743_16585 [Calditrichota bacterium]